MTQIVVPMAGLGKRFADSGYERPKPLITVSSMPMVVQAVRQLPNANRLVFVCHRLHVQNHAIDRVLHRYFPHAQIVIAPGLTQGQACSVRLAAPALNLGQPVLVAACDNGHLYRRDGFDQRIRPDDTDALIWTYRGDSRVLRRPTAHGWVDVDAQQNVKHVSVKVPLSDNPINDHAVTGTFWFRSAQLMIEGIDQLVASNERTNQEFYLDAVPNVLIERGRRVKVFEVQKYIGWGTPADLEDYQRWEQYFSSQRPAMTVSDSGSLSCCPTLEGDEGISRQVVTQRRAI